METLLYIMNKSGKPIYLQAIGRVNGEILKHLREDLRKQFDKFNFSIEIVKEAIPLKSSEYKESRKQYEGDFILDRLFQYSVERQFFRTLGILDVDIYSGSFNFNFGISTAPNNELLKYYGSCIISITRLRQEFYGYDKNYSLFRSRILKEAVHELGHTLGLSHCKNQCIMRFSNQLSHTDQKPMNFCNTCNKKLSRFLKKIHFKT